MYSLSSCPMSNSIIQWTLAIKSGSTLEPSSALSVWRIDKQWPNISDHWTLTPFVNGTGYFVICPCGLLESSRKWWLATKVKFWIDEWEPCLARVVDLNASSLNLQMGLFYKFCMLYNSLLDGHNVLLNPGIQTSRGHHLPPRGFQCGQNAQCFGWIHQTMHEARGEKS